MASRLTRRIIGAVAGVLLGMAASAHADGLPERVEKAAQERVAAGDYQTLVFAVVDGDQTRVVAFGKLDDGKAPDGDTVYEIGSITKTFTATLLAAAVRSGRLTLDTPVALLLPDFAIPSRSDTQITLDDLATQHAGLPRLPSNMLPADVANPYADYDETKLKAFLQDYQLPRNPGASYEYSNLGFGLLGHALAQSRQTTWADLVGKELLQPLGMTMSGVALTDTMRAHLATGHDLAGKPAKNWDLGVLAGAGALRSSANDMARYLKANMGIDPSPLAPAMLSAQQPRREVPKLGRIGLAWMTNAKGIVWHNGGTGGYRSFLGFAADRRHGVVILANTAADLDDLGFATLDGEAPLRPNFKAATLPDGALDDYVGSYRLSDRVLIKVFRRPDGLYAQATGQSALPIFPSAANEFFAKVGGISATFTRDATGAVNGLVLHQNGEHAAPKLSLSELPPEPRETLLDSAVLSDYVGRYKFDFGAVLDVVLKTDHLEAQLTAQSAFPVFASGRDEFFYKVVDAQLHFERDAGRVVAVILHQGGRDMRAPRISTPQ